MINVWNFKFYVKIIGSFLQIIAKALYRILYTGIPVPAVDTSGIMPVFDTGKRLKQIVSKTFKWAHHCNSVFTVCVCHFVLS